MQIYYPEGKLTLASVTCVRVACVREHKCEFCLPYYMYIDITVGPEPAILCVILSSREEPQCMYVSETRLSGAAYVGIQP